MRPVVIRVQTATVPCRSTRLKAAEAEERGEDFGAAPPVVPLRDERGSRRRGRARRVPILEDRGQHVFQSVGCCLDRRNLVFDPRADRS